MTEKEQYEPAVMEVIPFVVADIINTSEEGILLPIDPI